MNPRTGNVRPGTELRYVRESRARTAHVKTVLFDDEDVCEGTGESATGGAAALCGRCGTFGVPTTPDGVCFKEHAARDLLIVQTARNNFVIRDRAPGKDGRPWPTWYEATTPREAAMLLDVRIPLHARALRALDWFGFVAEEV